MGRAARHDDEFERMYRAEFPRLVRSLAVVYGANTAADAVQEAFLVAHRQWARIGGFADPAQWVRRVAINKLTTERRTRRRRSRILGAVRPPDPATMDAGTLEVLDQLKALPERQCVTACLYYVADYSTDEIAAAMGVSTGTVKSQLAEARAKLQKMEERDARPTA